MCSISTPPGHLFVVPEVFEDLEEEHQEELSQQAVNTLSLTI
jgi:hypothetical protein